MDAKKKEKVGELLVGRPGMGPAGKPLRVRSHEFPDKDLEHAVPYGIWDEQANNGFVNVGTDGNTAALAVESIRRWWAMAGKDAYTGAPGCSVACDAGGSTAAGTGTGRPGSPSWRRRPGCRSPSATSRPAPPNGTRSSTGCSARSAWPGGAAR